MLDTASERHGTTVGGYSVTMFVEWMPLAGPIGAVLGASATYWLTRSRMVVTVGHTSISPSDSASDLPVPSNLQLKQEVIASPHRLPILSDISVPERTYVWYLMELDQRLEREEASDETSLKSAEELRAHAAAEDFERLIETYKFTQQDLWAWAENEVRRGRTFFSLPWTPSDEEKELLSAHYFERPDEDLERVAGFVVDLPGAVNLGFHWSVKQPIQKNAASQALAERVVLAILRKKKSDLVEYFQGVRNAIAENLKDAKRLRQSIQQELEQFSRIQVDLLVSNPGRSGISLDYKAGIKIGLKNYPSGSVHREAGRISEDVIIEMTVVSEELAERAKKIAREGAVSAAKRGNAVPIVLQPGTTMRIVATSEKLLSSYLHGDALRSAYLGGERKMQVTLLRFRQPSFFQRRNDDTVSMVRSRKILFRNLSAGSRAVAKR